jgi:hypothetical protein
LDPTTTARLFAGVDISKDRLDVCLRWSEAERHEKEEAFFVAYDNSGIDALLSRLLKRLVWIVSSPSQQVGEGQTRTTELVVEPDTEVVQGYSRRQTCSQTLKLVRSLPPEAEGIEKFVVSALYDLADPGYPAPQTLGPHLAGVAFGRADKLRSVAPEPPEVVICPLEALVDHVG